MDNDILLIFLKTVYYETEKLQHVLVILFPQLSIIYNFIFLLIDLKIRVFESLKRSPFIFFAVLIVSQQFFALKFKLKCLKKNVSCNDPFLYY